MKPFSLDEYLKNPDRKIVTRDGKNVRIICTDRDDSVYSIVALTQERYGEKARYYTANGMFVGSAQQSENDLFFCTREERRMDKYT